MRTLVAAEDLKVGAVVVVRDVELTVVAISRLAGLVHIDLAGEVVDEGGASATHIRESVLFDASDGVVTRM